MSARPLDSYTEVRSRSGRVFLTNSIEMLDGWVQFAADAELLYAGSPVQEVSPFDEPIELAIPAYEVLRVRFAQDDDA